MILGTIVGLIFLSRLCGGEAKLAAAALAAIFLSRLCGGEAYPT